MNGTLKNEVTFSEAAVSRVHQTHECSTPNGGGSLEILWDDGARVFCRQWYRGDDGKVSSILVVKAVLEHPPAAVLERFAHELALRDELDRSWAVWPLELIRSGGRTLLTLEDPGGEALEQLLIAPMKLDHFLRLAVAITTSVEYLHRRSLVHKDLKPANILVIGANEVRITGFGLASRLPRARQQFEAAETIAGTFAYMAPEQTGRMNRSVDSRSDLYALGVTFYRMLTCALPFNAATPLEWAHCHVARLAVPPHELMNGVPAAVSAIIMRLLAKTAEDRYQTAAGLRNDLNHCLAEWATHGRIEQFPLAQSDRPDHLLIPEAIYGREHEIEALLASFDRVAQSGVPELILVSGSSGIGKSALVDEMQKSIVQSRGLFGSGKFDQHKRDVPYASLAQAFSGLIRNLLAKEEADLAPWRNALREALGPLAQLMGDLVPELRLLIGDQPSVPDASPRDAQRRFQLLFARFIGVFCTPAHPLVLFLDDLQWSDLATLDLIEYLLARSDLQNLLLIAAYRDNDAEMGHRLAARLAEICQSGKNVQGINLLPLTRESVGQFVADALRCDLPFALPIADIVYEKTRGSPLFFTQFLRTLAEEKLLVFDYDEGEWRWDLAGIKEKSYSDNVADLVVGKLSGLRDDARAALLELACLGNTAEFETLCLVHGTSEQALHSDLNDAVRLELVRHLNSSYAFVHDRVHEAAYALEPDLDRRAALHLRIGMALATQLTQAEPSERIYSVASQLNRGVTAAKTGDERNRIIAINLAAGQRARSATAYHAAVAYLEMARGLLEEKRSAQHSQIAFTIVLLHAECKFLLGDLTTAEAELRALSQSWSDVVRGAEVTSLRAQLYTAAGQLEPAVDVCLAFLRKVGIDWHPHPTRSQVDEDRRRLRALAEKSSDEQLRTLVPMADPDHRAIMRVLADLVTPAFLTDRNLSDIMLMEATRLTLEHGISPESCYPLTAIFGVLASDSTDAELAFRLSQFGASLAETRSKTGLSGRALLVFGLHVTPWIRPIRSGRSFVQRALEICLTTGDLAFAAYSHRGLLALDLFSGEALPGILLHAEQALGFAEALGIRLNSECLATQRALALSLMGRDAAFESSKPSSIEAPATTEPLSSFFDYVVRVQLEVLAGRSHDAIAFARCADEYAWCARAYCEFAEYRFYTGLAHAAAYDEASEEDREQHVICLREQYRKLVAWSDRCPANFGARCTLIAAELARIEGRVIEAERLYEAAIQLSQEGEFVQIEAISAERAAAFYEMRGIRTVVLSYVTNARDCYSRWGATAKVDQLQERYPSIREKGHVVHAASTIGTHVEQLDLATVLKVSEAVSGEIALEKLTETLLRSAIEHAAAERAVLVLPQGTDLRVRAQAAIGDGSIAFDLADLPLSGEALPLSIVLYTARTQESVVLDDASTSSAFGNDQYIRQNRTRSALCVPLVKQGKAVAFLYLENNLASRVFTPARIAILRFLASEAATSLDNARLYRELQERELRYREAQMELAHANRVAVMGQLTASIAHEVNQPNTAVISSAQAALTWLNHQPPALQQARKALTRVVENSVRSSEVIGRIRDIVKKAPPKRDALAINDVIGQVIELTQVEAARNRVSIRTAFADRLPNVIGDRVELQQVTLNLILNGVEAMSETAGAKRDLLIRTARADDESVLVSIADSGPGLSPEGFARLFEPFYTTKPAGLGVGLSICRSIILSHGGRLWADTSEPRGAVFQFTVPVDDGLSVI